MAACDQTVVWQRNHKKSIRGLHHYVGGTKGFVTALSNADCAIFPFDVFVVISIFGVLFTVKCIKCKPCRGDNGMYLAIYFSNKF